MQGGDISAESPEVVWVVDSVFCTSIPAVLPRDTKRRWRLASSTPVLDATIIDSVVMSRLWRFKSTVLSGAGIRLEALYFGALEGAETLSDLLDSSGGSAISSVVLVEDVKEAQRMLGERPDVIRVIDEAGKSVRWGNRGLTIDDI